MHSQTEEIDCNIPLADLEKHWADEVTTKGQIQIEFLTEHGNLYSSKTPQAKLISIVGSITERELHHAIKSLKTTLSRYGALFTNCCFDYLQQNPKSMDNEN